MTTTAQPLPRIGPDKGGHLSSAGHLMWSGIADIPADWGSCVATVGVFDGIHRGHLALVHTAVHQGRELGLPVVLITFDPHPARVTGQRRETAALTSLQRRAELAAAEGIDRVLVLTFDTQLAAETPRHFACRVFADELHTVSLVVGVDFRFGTRGSGDMALLTDMQTDEGWTVTGVPLVEQSGQRCSSTAIRVALATGDVVSAARMLGRPHRLEGQVTPDPEGPGSLLELTDPNAAALAAGNYRALLAHRTSEPAVMTELKVQPNGHLRLPGTWPGDARTGPIYVDLLEPA